MQPPSAAVCRDCVEPVSRVEFWEPASQHDVTRSRTTVSSLPLSPPEIAAVRVASVCPGRPTRRPSPAAVSGLRSVSVSDMMSLVAPLLTVLVTLLAVLPSGTAISCYQCSDLLDIDTDGDSSIAGAFDGLLNKIGKQAGLPPCSEFQRGRCPIPATRTVCSATAV